MSFSVFFAQAATNAATAAGADAAQTTAPAWSFWVTMIPLAGITYFLLIRPQSLAQKKQKETIGAAKTGDKVVMTNGIHGVISNVKESTFIVKIADNVKIEVEKTAVDKVARPAAEPAKA